MLRIDLIFAYTFHILAPDRYTQERQHIVANHITEDALAAIERIVGLHTKAIPASEIGRALPAPIPQRTLQYRLEGLSYTLTSLQNTAVMLSLSDSKYRDETLGNKEGNKRSDRWKQP